MTPNETAIYLIESYLEEEIIGLGRMHILTAKTLAIKSVQLLISANPHSNPFNTTGYSTMNYWYEVINEIRNFKKYDT